MEAAMDDGYSQPQAVTTVANGHHKDGDAAEWEQVAELRAVTEAQDPACKVRRPRPRPTPPPLPDRRAPAP
jgi:hypothetical protein